ncbi:MAG: MalY/PatB family protein [Ilumatobacteraceae bacterium]
MTRSPDLEHLSLDWLRAKPGAKWAKFDVPYAAWVADMDFRPPQCVTDAIQQFVEGGDLGYPNIAYPVGGSIATDAWVERCASHYDWHLDRDHTRELIDVVQGLQLVLHLCTAPGDGVVVHTPAYPPFLHSVEDTGRRVVRVAAQADPTASAGWRFDHDELDRRLRTERAKVLLLCHPHNPTGHVFSDDDLRALADIAERHDLLIISDEIHADLVYEGRHRPMALFAPDRTVTLHAASKAFNLAGVRFAIAHIGPAWVRERVATLPDHLLGATNIIGSLAAATAWRHGGEWLDAVLTRLDGNRRLLADLLATHLPEVRYTPPAATYLGWLDCRALGWGDDPTEEFARRGVRLSEGPNFGVEGHGFARLNFATSPDVLRAIVERMAAQ